MNPNINAKQFFHGTVASIKPGTAVEPPGSPDKSNFEQLYEEKGQEWRAQHVFSTPTEDTAWMWGAIAGNKQLHTPDTQARPRVYEVKPVGKPGRDVPSEIHQTDNEIISRKALVKHEIWTPPPSAARHVSSNWTPVGLAPRVIGMQGTLPPQDWRGTYADPMDSPERRQFRERPMATGPTTSDRLPPERTRMAGQRRLLPAASRRPTEERLAPILSRTQEFRRKLGLSERTNDPQYIEQHRRNVRARRAYRPGGEL
jgi:hypothetical protein